MPEPAYASIIGGKPLSFLRRRWLRRPLSQRRFPFPVILTVWRLPCASSLWA